jgi:hypothetical protein
VLEHLALFGPVVEVASRCASLPELSPRFVHEHDAIAVGPRERPQKHRIQDAEDGDRRADAERNGDHEHGGQHRAGDQLADCEAQVVSPVGPPLSSVHRPLPFFCQRLQSVFTR